MVINKFYNCVATRSPDNKRVMLMLMNLRRSVRASILLHISVLDYCIPSSLLTNVYHVNLIVVIVFCNVVPYIFLLLFCGS